MWVFCVYYVYINTHTNSIYFENIYMYLHVYIYIYIIYIIKHIFLKYIHLCVCIYIYIINIHSTNTYIMQTKTIILDAINHD